jgi:hypothetical protein
MDERTLYEDGRNVSQRMSQIEREWSASSSPDRGDAWDSTVTELDGRLDDLRQRIDRNQP